MGRAKPATVSPAVSQTPDGPAAEARFKPSVTGDTDSLTDLKADIDDLLSPYIDVPATRAAQDPQPGPRNADSRDRIGQRPTTQNNERPYPKPGQRQGDAASRSPAGDTLYSVIITEQMQAQVAEFVMQEIKRQISVWIAQNLDKIVEDALRSLPTETRDASGTRSAS